MHANIMHIILRMRTMLNINVLYGTIVSQNRSARYGRGGNLIGTALFYLDMYTRFSIYVYIYIYIYIYMYIHMNVNIFIYILKRDMYVYIYCSARYGRG
jgi:hypothetical protein